jgi:uncharacterized protein
VIRAVIDPGVLVAAALTPSGTCGQVLRAVLDERCVLIVCPALLHELEEVLLRAKFRRYLSLEQAERYVALVGLVGERSVDPVVTPSLTPDPDDDYLVALMHESGADCLVSGDPHLTVLAADGLPILDPRAFLKGLD